MALTVVVRSPNWNWFKPGPAKQPAVGGLAAKSFLVSATDEGNTEGAVANLDAQTDQLLPACRANHIPGPIWSNAPKCERFARAEIRVEQTLHRPSVLDELTQARGQGVHLASNPHVAERQETVVGNKKWRGQQIALPQRRLCRDTQPWPEGRNCNEYPDYNSRRHDNLP
jgi:hypothetical protein